MSPNIEIMDRTQENEPRLLSSEDPACEDTNRPDSPALENRKLIAKPGPHDVLLGRGGGTNNHVGNINFRKLVNEHKMRYFACSKVEKPSVARDVVQLWRKLDPPGRFLTRVEDGGANKDSSGTTKAAGTMWYEVGDKKAREKASQCLRERTADVMPLLKQLREQQEAITERGVSMFRQQMQAKEGMLGEKLDPFQPVNDLVPLPVYSGRALPVHPELPHHRANAVSRRTSCPTMRGPPAPMPVVSRRTSLPTVPQSAMPLPDSQMPSLDPTFSTSFGEPAFFGGIQEVEYQHQMLLMRRQMQAQQLQMHRLEMQRLELERMSSAYDPSLMQPIHEVTPMRNDMQATGAFVQPYEQHQHLSYHASHPSQPQQLGDSHLFAQPLSEKPVLNHPSMTSPKSNIPTSAMKPSSAKQSVQASVEEQDAKPEPHASFSPARLDDAMNPLNADAAGELTIEEYRKQLEQYLNNNQLLEEDEDDEEAQSDLEDDWEKEREKNRQAYRKESSKDRKRGVNRNVSGISFMSTDTQKSSNMSVLSGMSLLSSDLEDNEKLRTARSLGSNLSFMSGLTDASENLDDLRI